jgi:ABC-type dipeptide/oligopeptide/nickel transport system permease component
MKKLALIGLILLTGCQNPIGSAINKEGDKTRAELQSELATAKQEISAENQAMIEQLAQRFGNDMSTVVYYLNYLAGLPRQGATYPGDVR